MTERQKRIRRRRRIRKAKIFFRQLKLTVLDIMTALWTGLLTFAGRHPVLIALPLITFMALLAVDMSAFSKKIDRWEQEQAAIVRAEDGERDAGQQDAQKPLLTMRDIYGCDSLTGEYEFPWNTMSQDWGADDVDGFYYHEIAQECKDAGGALPVIIQVYTYIVCQNYGVDYEMVFALIEKESSCKWDASGDGGTSIGLMQVSNKWHADRMERLHRSDLSDPFTNVLIGVDFLAEIQDSFAGSVPEEDLPYYVLAVYNYGRNGAQKYLWNNGIVRYSYSNEIMQRAQQLKEEKRQAQIRAQEKMGG